MAVNTTATVLLTAVNTTAMTISTTLAEINATDAWPYFTVFGKTYFVFILLIALMGLVGNALSLVLMSDVRVNLFAYCIYMRWLAVSDSLVLITVSTEDITDVYGYLQAFLGHDIAICKLWSFIEATARTLSPWLMVALTCDRFISVLYPPLRDKICTKTKAIIICLSMTVMSAMTNIFLLTKNVIKDGECQPLMYPSLLNYLVFRDLIGISLLPCLLILILNVILVTKIQRSFSARRNFERSDSQVKKEQDKSTRPLILVTVFAFITLVPIGVTQVVEYLLDMKESDHRALRLANELWPLFNLIYLLNFSQNFYVMMASSSHYREIMANKLSCLGFLMKSNSEEEILLDLPPEESRVPEIFPHT